MQIVIKLVINKGFSIGNFFVVFPKNQFANCNCLFYFRMGCCESKLIGLESSSNKYEQGPICLNENFELNKKLMISIAPDVRENASSLQTLRIKLDSALNQFEQDKGPILLTFYKDFRPKSLRLSQKKTDEKAIQRSKNVKEQISSVINSQFDTESNLDSQSSSLSDYFQNNTKILSSASLNTKRELEKQLFYINSNQIGNTKLLKWSQENRLSWDVSESQILQLLQIKNKNKIINSNNQHSFQSFCCALLLSSFHKTSSGVNLLAYKQQKQGIGFRIFANGIKRMLNISVIDKWEQQAQQIYRKLDIYRSCPLSYWTYVLTGWIPEAINLADFNNNNQIFKRLLKNFNNGNLLIIFSTANQNQLLLTKQIDAKHENLLVVHVKRREQMVSQRTINWSEVASNYCCVHVNWNPLVYNFAKKVEAISVIKSVPCDNEVTYRTHPKIVLKVPASKSQLQVRVLVQLHQQQRPFECNFNLSLFESVGKYLNIEQSLTAIRKCTSTNPFFLSEIFIFQKSEQSSEYILTLQLQTSIQNDIQITFDFYTFGQIDAKFMEQPHLTKKEIIQSPYLVSSTGFGMNSPLFANNLQYSLSAVKGTTCNVKVRAQTAKPLTFEICVLPDKLNSKDITLIRPSELVKQVCQSEQYQNQGSLQFVAQCNNYIITIVGFTPTQGHLQVQIQHYTIGTQAQFTSERTNFTQISLNPQFWKQFPFFWKLTDPGPRKRTKSNSENIFYPIQTFDRFFQNPTMDYHLPKGLYQFSVVSKTFANSFTQTDLIENEDETCIGILSGSPPSLSLGIFELTANKDQAKIILDDYEYVPYGIGFWTAAIQLEGLYRFVFSKIEKTPDEGVFRIRKLDQT